MSLKVRHLALDSVLVLLVALLCLLARYAHPVVEIARPDTQFEFAELHDRSCLHTTEGYYDDSGEFIQDGADCWYETNGRLLSLETYRDGRLHGPSMSVYPRGVVYRTWFDEGRLLRSELTDPDGAVEYTGYLDREPFGPWRKLSAEGLLIGEGRLVHGYPEGTMKRYDPPGELYAETYWHDGKLIATKFCQPERPGVRIYAYELPD